ncbi:MAG: molybdopterin-guanine dinucleotide biosynthesis protein B [Elusimicrobiota bacterium]|nr:molybdopterin-guanine dinucleotide biosynthesis protein B [Elusimicrobiota bacterium]MDH5662253.1 molybdopterin-guanine dinucleotide biosynthesis protein B [Elusimicrobiota bacterium]
MKVIGIVGYKGSGKTHLGINLAEELRRRGYTVAIVKHAQGSLDLPDKDTALYRGHCDQLIAISQEGRAEFFKGKVNLEELLDSLDTDFVIVEGFKEKKNFPKIVCLREKGEEKELSLGLEIGLVGNGNFNPDRDISAIADMVVDKAFWLPGFDCGDCGFASCYELAREIVKGRKRVGDCTRLGEEVEVRVAGERMELNPFVTDILRKTIKGFLSGLKGLKQGKIRIKISDREER